VYSISKNRSKDKLKDNPVESDNLFSSKMNGPLFIAPKAKNKAALKTLKSILKRREINGIHNNDELWKQKVVRPPIASEKSIVQNQHLLTEKLSRKHRSSRSYVSDSEGTEDVNRSTTSQVS